MDSNRAWDIFAFILCVLVRTLIGYVQFHYGQDWDRNGEISKKIIEILLSFLGTLVGFIVSVVAIVTTVLDKPVFLRLRQSGQIQKMLHYFIRLIYTTLACFALLIACYVFASIDLIYIALGAALAIMGIWFLTFIYAMRLFYEVLKIAFQK
jgi:lipopolysaccharide/colanic/teichoic acid biosynthesis glycosyltransferase